MRVSRISTKRSRNQKTMFRNSFTYEGTLSAAAKVTNKL